MFYDILNVSPFMYLFYNTIVHSAAAAAAAPVLLISKPDFLIPNKETYSLSK